PPAPLPWATVAGHDAHVLRLREVLALLTATPRGGGVGRPLPFPRGVLLTGPPGTGKTLSIRVLASHARAANGGVSVPLYLIRGGEILSKYVGEGERRLRRLFDAATAAAPSILFFDQVDALAATRDDNRDHSRVVNTLLAFLDGFRSRGRVLVLAATNRVDLLDSAFRRPGRFDLELDFQLPDASDRRRLIALLEPTVSRVVGVLDTRFPRDMLTTPGAEWAAQAVGGPTSSASAAAMLAAWPVLPHRLLIAGRAGMGQSLVGAAVQSLPVFDVGFLSLTASGTDGQLPLLLSAVAAAVRVAPSVLYMPDAEMWMAESAAAAGGPPTALLRSVLARIPVDTPVLVLVIANATEDVTNAWAPTWSTVVRMDGASEQRRR
ncbi:hypothetical protein BU14_0999s0001, partial [Porphyra umbilicalis]